MGQHRQGRNKVWEVGGDQVISLEQGTRGAGESLIKEATKLEWGQKHNPRNENHLNS